MNFKTLLIAAVIAVMAAGGGVAAAALFLKGDEGKSAKAEKAEKTEKPVFVPLEPLVTNLQRAGGDGDSHYVQIALDFKVADPKVAEVIKQHKPEILHALLLLLASKGVGDLDHAEDKDALARQMVDLVNPIIGLKPAKGVREVMFTAFVVQ